MESMDVQFFIYVKPVGITLTALIHPNRQGGIRMKAKKDKDKKDPVMAAGNYDFLEERANKEEKKKGEFTRVTRLALDEVDPG